MKQIIFFAKRRRSVVSVIQILFLVLLLSSHHQIAIATSSNGNEDSSSDIISSSSQHHLRGCEQGDQDERLTNKVQQITEEEEEEDHPNNNLQQQQQTHRSLGDLVTPCFTEGPDGRYDELEKKGALFCIDAMREGVQWNSQRKCSENPPSYSYTCGNEIHSDWSKCVNSHAAAHESCKHKRFIRAEVYDAYRRSNCDYGYMTFYCHPWSAPPHTGWTPCVSNADAEAWDKYNRDNFADYLCKTFYSGTGLTGRWEQCGGRLSEYFAFECSK